MKRCMLLPESLQKRFCNTCIWFRVEYLLRIYLPLLFTSGRAGPLTGALAGIRRICVLFEISPFLFKASAPGLIGRGFLLFGPWKKNKYPFLPYHICCIVPDYHSVCLACFSPWINTCFPGIDKPPGVHSIIHRKDSTILYIFSLFLIDFRIMKW